MDQITNTSIFLIINSEGDSESEQYADWSHYLNQFASEAGKSFVFHKVTTDDLKKFVHDPNKYTNDFSMIFLKNGKPTFFYNGPILEPQVYKFVELTYLGKPIKPEYLTQFAPQEVIIKLRK